MSAIIALCIVGGAVLVLVYLRLLWLEAAEYRRLLDDYCAALDSRWALLDELVRRLEEAS